MNKMWFVGLLAASSLGADCCIPYTPLCNLLLAPRQNDCFTLEFTGEFLYMLPETGIDYIITGAGVSTAAGNPPINVPIPGSIYGANFEYQPGLRVGGSAHFGTNNAYDLTARYTLFRSHASGHFDTADQPDLAITVRSAGAFLIESNENRISIHNADIHFDMPENFIDLVGGYSIDVSRNLNFRPFAGLSGYWTDVAIQVNYAFFNPTGAGPVGEEIAHYHGKSVAWGIGPIVGLDGNWSLNKNLSIFGAFELAMHYVEWKMREIQQEVRLTAPGGAFNISRGKITSEVIGFTRNMLIGPQLDVWFAENRYHLMLRAAWQWVLNDGAHHAYLSAGVTDSFFVNELQGLNVSGSFEF